MAPDSFDEVVQLEASALRALLSSEVAVHRLWAAWAIGLRAGPGFVGEMASRIASEPNVGVRRHLAVMLAGTGDRAAVAALAAHDPSELVRGTAHRLALQIATEDRPEIVDRVLAAARSEPSAYVRVECLRLLVDAAHPAMLERAARCLDDPHVEVRASAADLLFALPTDGPAATRLARSAAIESDAAEQSRVYRRLIEAGHIEPALREATSQAPPPHAVKAVLQVLVAMGRTVGWPRLASLAALHDDAIDQLLFEAVDDVTSADIAFLASRAIAGLDAPRDHAQEYVGWRALDALVMIGGGDCSHVVLDSETRSAVQRILDATTTNPRLVNAWFAADDCDPDEEFSRERVQSTLRCLLGAGVRLG